LKSLPSSPSSKTETAEAESTWEVSADLPLNARRWMMRHPSSPCILIYNARQRVFCRRECPLNKKNCFQVQAPLLARSLTPLDGDGPSVETRAQIVVQRSSASPPSLHRLAMHGPCESFPPRPANNSIICVTLIFGVIFPGKTSSGKTTHTAADARGHPLGDGAPHRPTHGARAPCASGGATRGSGEEEPPGLGRDPCPRHPVDGCCQQSAPPRE